LKSGEQRRQRIDEGKRWLPVLQRLDRTDPNPIADASVVLPRKPFFRGTAEMQETPEERETRMRELRAATAVQGRKDERAIHPPPHGGHVAAGERDLTLKEAEDLLGILEPKPNAVKSSH
jgi:hypothetical protein